MAGRCGAFIAVSGIAAHPGYHVPETLNPYGMQLSATAATADPSRAATEGETKALRFSLLIRESERHVLALHASGAFASVVLFRDCRP